MAQAALMPRDRRQWPCRYVSLRNPSVCIWRARWRVSSPQTIVLTVCSRHLHPLLGIFSRSWWPPDGDIDVTVEDLRQVYGVSTDGLAFTDHSFAWTNE